MSNRASHTIYVGNLPLDVRQREIEDLFYKYGHIVKVELKNPPRPPGYCFIEVEFAHGGRGFSSSGGRSSRHGGEANRHGVSHRSEHRVVVRGLPSSASWQDLKDHMRKAGDVCFAQVFQNGDGATGLVDYTNYDDMKYAVRKLDDTEFRNPYTKSYIRVKIYEGSMSRSPSRSRSKSRTRSRSRSNSINHRIVRRASKSVSPRSRSRSR